MNTRYQLRYAAGVYWLLDMEQRGKEFVPPVMLNSAGADIWRVWLQGEQEDSVIAMLCKKYGLSEEQARTDYKQFRDQAKEQGIL